MDMTTITEDYVSFEIAKLLKKKGFNEECFALYNPDGVLIQSGIRLNNIQVGRVEGSYSAPTLQMVMKWLREVHYLHITVHPGVSEYGFVWTYAIVFAKEAGKGETHFYKISQITTPIVKSKSYEQACEAAIQYCLKHLI